MTPEELKGALKRQLAPRRAKWQKPAAVVRALGLRRGQVIAEVGSGPGYFTPRLARAVGPRVTSMRSIPSRRCWM